MNSTSYAVIYGTGLVREILLIYSVDSLVLVATTISAGCISWFSIFVDCLKALDSISIILSAMSWTIHKMPFVLLLNCRIESILLSAGIISFFNFVCQSSIILFAA